MEKKPNEKAKELIDQFLNQMPKYLQGKLGRKTAKENSLLCVSEILKALKWTPHLHVERIKYWEKVKEELETI